MRYLALLGTLLLASGCWGGQFSDGLEKAEPTTTDGVTSTSAGTGSGGSDAASNSGTTTSTTTGSSGSGGSDTTTSTTGVPEACRPPTEIPELSKLVLGEYNKSLQLCDGGGGRLTCAESPCLAIDLDVTLISVSDDGFLFDVIVTEQEPWEVPLVHHCEEFGEATCYWRVKSAAFKSTYTLELIETPTGYAVGDFYTKGQPQHNVLNNPPFVAGGGGVVGVQDPNCVRASRFNPNDTFLQEAWQQHLDKIHSLSWECAS